MVLHRIQLAWDIISIFHSLDGVWILIKAMKNSPPCFFLFCYRHHYVELVLSDYCSDLLFYFNIFVMICIKNPPQNECKKKGKNLLT